MLPLPVPEAIHLDPANVCNFRCTFCPTADRELLASVGRPAGTMKYELYCKIIDDLKEMVDEHNMRPNLLQLYKDGEPLIHKRFPDMVSYAKKAKVADVVSTTTNGALLTEELSGRIIESGLDQIRVSIIHVTDEAYKEIAQTYNDYAKIKENVGFLYREKKRLKGGLRVIVKINDSALTEEEKRKFTEDFASNCDVVRIDSMMGWSLSEVKDFTLGVQVTTGMDGVSPLRERSVCPEPFSRLAINFDGQVSVCCVDWSYGTIVGDLRTESLKEIWNGEKLREFRMAHLNGQRESIPACANCQYVKGAPLSRDLDDHVERLKSVYSQIEV
jgi:radical SAM protein with 4Fe4S-binding SPASM domain